MQLQYIGPESATVRLGTSNKWEGVLTEGDLAMYDVAISELLEPDQRNWLEWGSN